MVLSHNKLPKELQSSLKLILQLSVTQMEECNAIFTKKNLCSDDSGTV